MVIAIDRCVSGITGFDRLCQGGFVRNSVNAIVGGPGTGKTIFCLQFLWGGLQNGENGLYISFEPDVSEVFQDAYALGYDFSKYDARGECKFMRLSPTTLTREIERQLTEVVSRQDIKRVCIDPISVFAMTLKEESEVREAIYNLCSLLKRLKVTVLLSTETHGEAPLDVSGGERLSRNGVIEFLVDGVVTLHSVGLGGESDRAVRIVKMRRTAHTRGPVAMEITNKGIIVRPSR